MAMDAEWKVSIRAVTLESFTAIFTDQSVGDPDEWLWDFGDGYCSTEQNPTHIYTGRWERATKQWSWNAVYWDWQMLRPIEYTVRLTSWKNGTVIVDPIDPDGKVTVSSFEEDLPTQEAAQNAAWATLPISGWDGTEFNGMQYRLYDGVGGWEHRLAYRDSVLDFSAYPAATTVAWFHMTINSMLFGDRSYVNDFDYAIKMGEWDTTLLGGAGDFGADSQAFKIADKSVEVDWEVFSCQDYFGTSKTTIRCVDAHEFEFALRPSGLGLVGWTMENTVPLMHMRTMPAVDKDIKTRIISTSPLIITRPPVLYSGIKESYFRGGWENEKYLYIEQSSPYPTIIEFIDIYAETENDE